MDKVLWYSEASVSSTTRVFCAGTLAQCVRRWARLSEADQSAATIRLGSHTEGREILSHDQVVVLSKRPDLYRV
ncbi:MAG TPA: hypothetical protein VNW15_07520 [Rhizomicrobium sp.]|jgi:hypothetical protein|nr:hypothetical protein [Rhizomicrobium sp.]